MDYTFKIQGSADEPYTVRLTNTSGDFKAICDCPAGNLLVMCKHVLPFFENKLPKDIIEGNVNALEEIHAAFQQSEGAPVLQGMQDIEQQMAVLKKELANRKKQLARVTLGGTI